MSNLVWTKNTKPDRPGIWMKNDGSVRRVIELDSQPLGTWCFLMDLPTIADPPKYRTPTMADVVSANPICEFRDSELHSWQVRELLAVMPADFTYRFIARTDSCDACASFKFARIVDTDTEPKREPREWWINEYGSQPPSTRAYTSRSNADKAASMSRTNCIRVREVID
jgi:hypothetical protein